MQTPYTKGNIWQKQGDNLGRQAEIGGLPERPLRALQKAPNLYL